MINSFSIKRYPWVGFSILAAVVICFVLRTDAQAASRMTTDEFLDYSLWALQQDVERLTEENRKMAERNRSLKKSILSLKAEMQSLAEKKQQLLQYRSGLQDEVSFESQGSSFWREKLLNTEYAFDILSKQRRRLLQSIRREQKRRDMLQREIAWTAQQLRTIGKDALGVDPEYQQMLFQEEKRRLREELSFQNEQYDRLEDEVAVLREDVQAFDLEKSRYTEESRLLEDELQQIETELAAIRDQQQRLKLRALWFVDEKENRIFALKNEIEEWRWYRDQLKDGIAQVRDAHQMIMTENRQHGRQLNAWHNLLSKNKELLERRQQGLQETLSAAREVRSGLEERLKLRASMDALNNKIADMVVRQEKVRARVDEDNKQAQVLTDQRRELERSIERLTRQAREAQAEAERARLAKINRAKKDLSQNIQSQTRQLSSMDHEIERARGQIRSLSEQLVTLKNRQQEMRQQMVSLDDQQDDLSQEQSHLQALQTQLVQKQKLAGSQISVHIEDLRLRRDILASSLAAVKTRYQEDSEDFRREEKELKEYLQILRKENRSLQKRILFLMNTRNSDE